MTLTRKQGIAGLVALVVIALLAYGAWIATAAIRDPYHGLTTQAERQIDEATRRNVEQRIAITQAAIAAAEAAGEEVDLNFYLNIANDAYILGDLVMAREALEKQLEANSSHYAAWNFYGSVLEEMGDTAKALVAYDKAVELDGEIEEFYRDYYNLILEVHPENTEAQKALLELSVETLGQTPWNMTSLGEWYLAQADCPRAIDHYEVAVQLAPKSQAIKEDLSEVRRSCN